MNSLPPRPAAATRRGFVLRSFHMQIESDGKTFVTGYNVQPSSFVSLLLCRTRSRRVPPPPPLPLQFFSALLRHVMVPALETKTVSKTEVVSCHKIWSARASPYSSRLRQQAAAATTCRYSVEVGVNELVASIPVCVRMCAFRWDDLP